MPVTNLRHALPANDNGRLRPDDAPVRLSVVLAELGFPVPREDGEQKAAA